MITWLVGPSGAGKSTVGRRLAELRGERFADVDAIVEQGAGMPIREIFAQRGEEAFRALEVMVIEKLATSANTAVIAVGAGALVREGAREAIRGTGTSIYLEVDEATALARISVDGTRPLLNVDDRAAEWRRLFRTREGAYRDSDITVDARGSVAEVTIAIESALQSNDQPLWSYDAQPGGEWTSVSSHRSIRKLFERAQAIVGDRRCAVVCDARVAETLERTRALHALGLVHRIDAGEASKTLATVEQLLEHFTGLGLTRDALVIAIGGGVVSDVAGFAASIYMRGIQSLYVPTTLLAQVDAAIGGKTAVNAAGVRNLAGTVRQPRHVLIATAFLRTLPMRELRSGFVESVKMGIANSDELSRTVDGAISEILGGTIPATIDEVVRLSVRTKLEVVERDSHDANVRLSLNFGHTFGHALEGVEEGRHAHGEAVAFGIVAASFAALELGRITRARHDDILRQVLPFARPVGADHDVDAIAQAMFTDKKRTSRALRLVLPTERTGVVIHETSNRELLVRAISSAVDAIGDGLDEQ